ncbi:Methyltransferase type 11 domain-containing protein [Strongyloides ratti]|uniref:Methyltransferase type 11 domain-containing protein n=1 Tax=Strongyloides ratti TaxID=34506 RepID=A0A090LFR3_STRRB|nr:Methyltransferase type 11 domain-containing protein [Strongyloides ratti]CEF66988.1 Methyltransferase type 11 domain-containing protein [Strongyloides ratti]
MSIDLTKNFLKLLYYFNRQDLVSFCHEHHILFNEAKKTGDHGPVTTHYYEVMSGVIDEYFNGNFHFVPPRNKSILLEDALEELHKRIGETLQLDETKNCLDIGCGIGGVIRDLAYTKASITGVTIAPNEVIIGNEELKKRKIYPRCQLIEADCHKMPFNNNQFSCAYAIYSLKYFVDLKPALLEISRVLKKGDLHREQIEGLEYACGMPSLHSKDEMITIAKECNLHFIENIDLTKETNEPFYYCFSSNKVFMWLAQSDLIGFLIKTGQALNILPKGFYEFNKIFLSGTVNKIVKSGEMGILSGGEILVFEKI